MKHVHARRHDLPFHWPNPPLRVVLVHPQIPPNTGNIARLCAATGSELHLIEPLGFSITNAQLKRAGLDYWDSISPRVHPNLESFLKDKPQRLFLFSTAGTRSYLEASFQEGDALLFGAETTGLPQTLLDQHPESIFGIPIQTQHVRSLNLSSAVALVVYEALRQIQLQPNLR
jgi:tRNA (cytidine/uridine-2'-O-)-methyltransferase